MTPPRKPKAAEPEDFTADDAAAAEDLVPESAAAAAPVDVKKGELTDSVIHGGETYPAGTKASDLDLTDDQTARLKRLGLIA